MSRSVAVLMASTSLPSRASSRSARADSTARLLRPVDLVALLLGGASRSGTRACRPGCGPRPPRGAGGPPRRAASASLDHLVDVVLVERRLAGDRHRLLLARGPVLGRHVHDAVGVDVERDLDLGHAAGRGRQVDELELAERLVELGHLALALQHVDLDRRLDVLGGGEHLGAPGGDGGVALDELGHDAALGLDAEGQRRDVEQQDVLDLALEHAGLDGGADGDDLVGVDALVGLLAGERRRPGR